MKLLEQILYFLKMLVLNHKIKKEIERQEKYNEDQNAIKADPVAWSNNRGNGVQSSHDNDTDGNR